MVTSGGTNTGVMKLIGKAMKNHNLTRVQSNARSTTKSKTVDMAHLVSNTLNVAHLGLENKQEEWMIHDMRATPITCIGIATWGIVTGREILFSAAGQSVEYPMQRVPSPGSTYIDPNHTHHLLVDDGSVGQYGVEIEFRAKLETALTRRSEATAVTAPLVSILIEGGPNSLLTAAEALKSQTPCVILKGTGRAADVLADAHSLYVSSQKEDGYTWDQFKAAKSAVIAGYLSKGLKLNETQTAKYLAIVFECLLHVKNLHVFEVGDGTHEDLGAKSLARMIVDAFLDKDQHDLNQERMEREALWRSLCLSFQWDHREAAKKILEKSLSSTFEAVDVNRLFVLAVKTKKLDFIDLFLDTVVNLKDHDAEIFKMLFELGSHRDSLDHQIQRIVGQVWSTESRYLSTKANPYNYLFIYAVSSHDMGLAWFLLKKVKYPIASCLIAYNILRRSADRESLGNAHNEYLVEAEKFEEEAYHLLTECAAACPLRARFLLLREIATLGSVSVMQLAIHGECLNFISHKVCQAMFQQMWFGGLLPTPSFWRPNLATVCFPLAPCLLQYVAEGSEEIANLDFANLDADMEMQLSELTSVGIDVGFRYEMSYFDKCVKFLDAPRIKFGYSIVSYIFLLGFFSVVIMKEADDFEEKAPDFYEAAVFLFWLHFLLQEVNQVVANGRASSIMSLGKNLMTHLKDAWNFIDALINVMIIAAVVVRMIHVSEVQGDAGVAGLTIKMVYCVIYMLFWLRLLHVFMLTSFLGPKLVMIQMMLKDVVYISFCFFILGTSYSIVSYSLQASLAHECCGGHEATNVTSYINLAHELFSTSWWNLFGEVGEFEGFESKTHPHPFFEFMELILLPGMKGFYMLIAGIILLNLLIAMFSYSFTTIQDQSHRIWCFSKHDLIFEYYDRSKLPAPLALVSLLKRFICRSRCCRRFKPANRFISSKRTFKVRLEETRESGEWKDGGKWAAKFAKTLKRWEEIVANNYWLTKKK